MIDKDQASQNEFLEVIKNSQFQLKREQKTFTQEAPGSFSGEIHNNDPHQFYF